MTLHLRQARVAVLRFNPGGPDTFDTEALTTNPPFIEALARLVECHLEAEPWPA